MAIHVLSIGNSFSQDAQRYLHDLARGEGTELETVNLMIGGCSLERHFRNLKGEKRDYTLEVNGHFAEGFLTTIQEALTARKWDAVTLQQASHFSYLAETYQPYLGVLAAAVREYCPGAKLYLHQTWAYETGSERIRRHGFETYEEMFARVKDCYDRAAQEIRADGLIPSGDAFRIALEKGIGRIHRDTFHASLGAGRFLLALVWYAYLIGSPIDQVRFRNFEEPVSEEECGIVLQAAGEALRLP